MLRATKLFSVVFFLMLSMASVSQAQAQSTYELGPFLAIGFGETASQAQADAYAEAWDMVDSIAAILPQGHEIIDFVVESQEQLGNSCMLEFHIVVGYDGLPGVVGPGPGGPGA